MRDHTMAFFGISLLIIIVAFVAYVLNLALPISNTNDVIAVILCAVLGVLVVFKLVPAIIEDL